MSCKSILTHRIDPITRTHIVNLLCEEHGPVFVLESAPGPVCRKVTLELNKAWSEHADQHKPEDYQI